MPALPVRVILLGSAAVIVFDLLASLASLQFAFPYGRAAIGSYAIYLAIGFFAARASSAKAIAIAAATAGTAGLVDASVGWAVSWALGPGRPPNGQSLSVALWFGVAAFVVTLAAAIGALGGVIGRRSELGVTTQGSTTAQN